MLALQRFQDFATGNLDAKQLSGQDARTTDLIADRILWDS
jgi:hypothetical protein